MDYELAKKLKDAGFPQEYHDCVSDSSGNCVCHTDRIVKDITLPTLSELIKACGDRFSQLLRLDKSEWQAWTSGFIKNKYHQDKWDGRGTTPEEAVANLWLALKKKKVIY